MMKKRYFAIPILAIALHFLLSNLLYFLVERLVLDVFHIPSQQFMKHSYWGEILIYAVLILVFFTLYNLLWRKDISEPRTATNFKDVLGSLVVGFGICGISGLWIMLAEQLLGREIPMIEISAKEELGIQELEKTLEKMFLKGSLSFNDEIYITNIRQKAALQSARESLHKVIESIENEMPEDFYSIDLMDAYESLGSITGETIGEDLVNEIFSKFCMGK